MTEPNKHRHAKPKRAARPSAAPPTEDRAAQIRDAVSGGGSRRSTAPRRSAGTGGGFSLVGFFRTTPGLVVAAVVVLGLAFVIRLVVTSGDDDASAGKVDPRTPGAANASYGNQWTSPDGFDYEISVATLNDLVATGSPSSCIANPQAGKSTNLHFSVTIKNRSKKEAPVPEVRFGSNLTPTGGVRKDLPSFAKSDQVVEITPLVQARTCEDGAKLSGEHRDKIPAGGTATFTGTFGPAKVPLPRGITILVRYFEKDGSKTKPGDFLATFGEFPTTS